MGTQEQRLTITAVREDVPVACRFVVTAARAAGLDDSAQHQVQLAVDEACTNIVEHGYRRDAANQWIEVVCRIEDDRLVAEVIDDGPPFDPLRRSDPDPSQALEGREPGGWGIYFIKKLMDEVSYRHDGSRNILTMSKHLNNHRDAGGE